MLSTDIGYRRGPVASFGCAIFARGEGDARGVTGIALLPRALGVLPGPFPDAGSVELRRLRGRPGQTMSGLFRSFPPASPIALSSDARCFRTMGPSRS